ncbi:hypothetical protein BpHYR1_049651 [Brachionus plicatilis]|uniref:Uncharacterized protein n=1 Tax=Brachionus plicatilis TaxID=10195 RepID=A0A3M7R5U4_BRAPC|nr:hypothetical protein BpHYR1_049651 [Brachionus plicatilis]
MTTAKKFLFIWNIRSHQRLFSFFFLKYTGCQKKVNLIWKNRINQKKLSNNRLGLWDLTFRSTIPIEPPPFCNLDRALSEKAEIQTKLIVYMQSQTTNKTNRQKKFYNDNQS